MRKITIYITIFAVIYLYVLRLVESKNRDVSKNVANLRADHDQDQYHADAHVQRERTEIDFLWRDNQIRSG